MVLKLVLFVFALTILSGCTGYTPDQTARFKSILAEFTALKEEFKLISKSVKDGTLNVEEGKAAYAKLEAKGKALDTEWTELKKSGLSMWEILGGLALTVLGSVTGLRKLQGIRPKSDGVLGI